MAGREADFQAGFALALRYAKHLQCPNIHVMAGIAPAEKEQAKHTYINNLQWAAKQATALGIKVLIEPINTRDMPGYYLNYQAQAHALLADIGAPTYKYKWMCTIAKLWKAILLANCASMCHWQRRTYSNCWCSTVP